MANAGMPQEAIDDFSEHFNLINGGYTGLIPESIIDPVKTAREWEDLDLPSVIDLRSTVVMAKLNGGLATTMGIDGAKSALTVKDGLTFLDVIALQAIGAGPSPMPVIFLNSAQTQRQTSTILGRYANRLTFQFLMQSRVPRLASEDLTPVDFPENPALEWCPPGHGEFLQMLRRGLAAKMVGRGIRFVFVSNADNLGATFDARIPSLMLRERIPFVVEVCQRTSEDIKGGHIARTKDTGRLLVRDSNMVTPSDWDAYVDNARHRYFNTNNLWIDLAALVDLREGPTNPLPLIVNHKTLDPKREDSPPVIQLETGMGTVMSLFDGAVPVVVPRARFVPVKDTSQLLLLRSDFYQLDNATYRLIPARETRPRVGLDRRFYRVLDSFERRFPNGPPSLIDCTSLDVKGDVTFAGHLALSGEFRVDTASPVTIRPSGSSNR